MKFAPKFVNISDTIVFDIETQNFFTDPEVGWDNFPALKISVVGVYSYNRDAYFCFEESEIELLAEFFRGANRIVGFGSNNYDVPVLNLYFRKIANNAELNLWEKERVDLLEAVQMATGSRIGLSKLAEANLGVKKDLHGRDAVRLYREGRVEELKAYCLSDVRLTKELYDRYAGGKELFVPDRKTGTLMSVTLVKPAYAQ